MAETRTKPKPQSSEQIGDYWIIDINDEDGNHAVWASHGGGLLFAAEEKAEDRLGEARVMWPNATVRACRISARVAD